MSQSEPEVIVIGGGLAGLTCAAFLAREGRQVLVLEQHKVPGGYCASFSRGGIVFSSAIHWVRNPVAVGHLLQELEVPCSEFAPVESMLRITGPDEGTDILLAKDRNAFESTILNSFPAVSKESVSRLVDLSLELDKCVGHMLPENPELLSLFSKVLMGAKMAFKLRKILKFSNQTIDELLEDLFPGEELRGLRAALHSFIPVPGLSAISLLFLLSMGLKGKASYYHGGGREIAEALIEAVQSNGGTILCSCQVSEIQVRNGRAVGVRLADGRHFKAPCVVSAVDAKQTFGELLDPSLVPSGFKEKLDTTPVGNSVFVVSLAADVDPSDFGFDGTDIMLNSAWNPPEMFTSDDPDKLSICLVFNTLQDPTCRQEGTPPNVHGIQIEAPATFEHAHRWKTGAGLHRGKNYRVYKRAFAQRLIARAETLLPGLSKRILELDIATPITFYRYTLNSQGSMMGWKDMKLWKQKSAFVPGLYQAGHWTFPGAGGVDNVMLSGKYAAQLILRDKI